MRLSLRGEDVQIGKGGRGVSHICQGMADRIEVRGRDLRGDLMGRLSAGHGEAVCEHR